MSIFNTLPPLKAGQGINFDGETISVAFPVGYIYMSTDSTSPASLFGGTWTQLKDRFLLGAGGSYAAGGTGGDATVTLSLDQIPSHAHSVKEQNGGGTLSGWALAINNGTYKNNTADNYIGSAGGGNAHNNMPPYIAVYMWKRVA